MNRLHTILTVVLSLALMTSLTIWWKIQRDLQRELHSVTDANEFLKKTLEDLIIAVSNKDKEIDRLYKGKLAVQVHSLDFQALVPPAGSKAPILHANEPGKDEERSDFRKTRRQKARHV